MRTFIRNTTVGGWAIKIMVSAILVAALLMAFGQTPRPAAAPLSDGLIADIYGNYEIHPDDGIVNVDWYVDLDNTGPSPYLDVSDALNKPSEIQVLLPDGFSDFQAFGPSGSPVSSTLDNIGYGTWANVSLGSPLEYGEQHSFSYSYAMSNSEEAGIIIRENYVSFFADHGLWLPDEYNVSVVSFAVPWEHADNVVITGADCDQFGNSFSVVYDCYGDEFGIFADIEIVDPGSRIVSTQTIDINGRPTELILRYLEGDDAWAENATRITKTGVPLLGEIMGIPYDGPATIRISEKGGSELYGYAGLANCDAAMCAVAVAPSADDQTLLHELAHMWTEPFDNRWLAEGIAEYASLKAAGELGVPGYEEFTDPTLAPDASAWVWGLYIEESSPAFALDRWSGFGGFGDLEPIDEIEAYHWSARFFQELELEAGSTPFAAVNAETIFEVVDASIDTQAYIDLVEDVGGTSADGLFASYIFAEDEQQLLADRRSARDRIAAVEARATSDAPELSIGVLDPIQDDIAQWNFVRALKTLDDVEAGLESYVAIRNDLGELRRDAEAAGLAYPQPYTDAGQTWEFGEVEATFDDAREALAGYVAAAAETDSQGDIFARIGLLGKDTSSGLQAAADDFAWTRFDESLAHSGSVEQLMDRAHSDGVTYVIVVAIVISAMGLFVAGAFVISRRGEPSPVGSGS
jgi:hypothetical protein